MGVFDTYCAFCSGPLRDAFEGWHHFLTMSGENDVWPPEDGKWRNPGGYPVPTKEIREIIRISREDGECWEDWVCLGPLWPEYVSPTCVEGDYGSILINGADVTNTISHPVRIHRSCLSLFFAFTNSTPQSLYESLHGEGSDYSRYGEAGNGLLYCLDYFDVQERSGQFFAYGLTKQSLREGETEVADRWDDPDTMEDCNWLLARPAVFPTVPSLPIPATSPTSITPSTSSGSGSAVAKVLHMLELLDQILSALIEAIPKDALFNERLSCVNTFVPASVDSVTRTVFALLGVNKHLHNYILVSRQDLFISLAWHHAWILPCTAVDRREWTKSNPQIILSELNGGSSGYTAPAFPRQLGRDWRTYLLTFLRKNTADADPHIRNRWRMYRMALQYARGKKMAAREGVEAWKWHCGDAGYTPLVGGDDDTKEWELPTTDAA